MNMHSKIITYDNIIELKDKKNLQLRVEIFKIKNFSVENKHLINELISRKQTYSLYISKKEILLFMYYFKDELEKIDSNEISSNNFLSCYVDKFNESDNYFPLQKIKKIKEKKDLIEITNENNEKTFYRIYVCRLKKGEQLLEKDIAKYFIDIANLDFFDVVISQKFDNKDGKKGENWGIFLVAKHKKEEELELKHKHFLNFISRKIKSFNINFVKATKSDIEWNKTKFQLLLPWIRHSGNLAFKLNFDSFFINFNTVIKLNLKEKQTNLDKEKGVRLVQKIEKKPLPSVKEIENKLRISNNDFKLKKDEIKTKIEEPIIIKTIPKTTEISKKSNKNSIRRTVSGIFKTIGFKESLIFNNKFDIVLRRGTSYIFVIISPDTFLAHNAYELVEELSGIAGLRNNFLALVIAPVFEKQAEKVLRDYNIIMINKFESMDEERLKQVLYEKSSELYSFLPAV
ncbi:MAG: hypothetical protein ACTSVB_08365 [Candidatus Heimdallarchaeaceae archaeon]